MSRLVRTPRLGTLGWLAVLALAVVFPFMANSYRVSQLTLVLCYAVAVVGLNILLGFSGQITLGHGAFFALGAYVAGILVGTHGWPHLLALPVAALVCGVAGFVIGIPALRLHGLYLAIVTLGVAVAFPQLIKRFESLTGGSGGLSAPQPTAPSFLDWLASDQYLYLLNLAIAIPMFILAIGLVRGHVGRALVSIRDNEVAAKAFGVNLARYKTTAFAISAAFAGIGGSMFTFSIGFVAPESFGFILSFTFLAAAVVGGVATIPGAIFGALFMEFVPVWAADVNDALASVIYGAVLIGFMYVLPGGAMSLVGRLRRRRRRSSARVGARQPDTRTASPAHQ
jgi:branched-chain amino acid transport system permease protein